MDFVIFGLGTGAALVLIGWLGRDLGPRLRYRAQPVGDEVLGVEELVARVSWARFCGSGGAALALCGVFMLLMTAATLLLRVDDVTGRTTMLVAFGLVLVAMGFWSWAYVRRFGVYGVLPPRREHTELKATPATDQPASAPVSLTSNHEPSQPAEQLMAASSAEEPATVAAATPTEAVDGSPEETVSDETPVPEALPEQREQPAQGGASTADSTADLTATERTEPGPDEPGPDEESVVEVADSDRGELPGSTETVPSERTAETPQESPARVESEAPSTSALNGETPLTAEGEPAADPPDGDTTTDRGSEDSPASPRPRRRRARAQGKESDYLTRNRPASTSGRSARTVSTATESDA